MGGMEKKGSHGGRTKGGLITMPFIFGKLSCCSLIKVIKLFLFIFVLLRWFFLHVANEACEKLAVVGFSANMITYLTQQLHLPLTKAANTITNFSGTASLTPLLGAFISDAYAGRFWTITVASILWQMVKKFFSLSPMKY